MAKQGLVCGEITTNTGTPAFGYGEVNEQGISTKLPTKQKNVIRSQCFEELCKLASHVFSFCSPGPSVLCAFVLLYGLYNKLQSTIQRLMCGQKKIWKHQIALGINMGAGCPARPKKKEHRFPPNTGPDCPKLSST